MAKRRGWLSVGAATIALLMLARGEVFMTDVRAAVTNVVLVHGAFVDGSGWQGVFQHLVKDGFTVTIVQNPTTSLADDVARTRLALAAQNRRSWLVTPTVVS